jgi:hypothetical protein
MLEKGPVMKIQNVEPGSPAEKAGNLKQGDIIESINGVKLTDTKRDPRLVPCLLFEQGVYLLIDLVMPVRINVQCLNSINRPRDAEHTGAHPDPLIANSSH